MGATGAASTRRSAWALTGLLLPPLLSPRTMQEPIGFIFGAATIGLIMALVLYVLARVFDKTTPRTFAALPFLQMSLLASLVFVALVILSLFFRFNPLASLTAMSTPEGVVFGGIVELLIGLSAIAMILFGQLLPGTRIARS